MKKIICFIMVLLFTINLFPDYSSLTKDEKEKVLWAFEKSKVYNDLVKGNYTVKIISATILKKDEMEKGKFIYWVRLVYQKISKSTTEAIETEIVIPVKIEVQGDGISTFGKILILVGTFFTGFFLGGANQ